MVPTGNKHVNHRVNHMEPIANKINVNLCCQYAAITNTSYKKHVSNIFKAVLVVYVILSKSLPSICAPLGSLSHIHTHTRTGIRIHRESCGVFEWFIYIFCLYEQGSPCVCVNFLQFFHNVSVAGSFILRTLDKCL